VHDPPERAERRVARHGRELELLVKDHPTHRDAQERDDQRDAVASGAGRHQRTRGGSLARPSPASNWFRPETSSRGGGGRECATSVPRANGVPRPAKTARQTRHARSRRDGSAKETRSGGECQQYRTPSARTYSPSAGPPRSLDTERP